MTEYYTDSEQDTEVIRAPSRIYTVIDGELYVVVDSTLPGAKLMTYEGDYGVL